MAKRRHDPAAESAERLLGAVLVARRDTLLRVHAGKLRRADLEECLGQATLELVVAIRRGTRLESRQHVEAALEQRFTSRIADHHRAVAGRSPLRAALERAATVGEVDSPDVADRRADTERMLVQRERLCAIAGHTDSLSPAERLVIGTQLGLPLDAASVCSAAGWSAAKYRKTAQRARDRLRQAAA